MRELVFDPVAPEAAIIAAIALSVAAVVLGIVRGARGWPLRAIGLAALIGLLLNPLFRIAETTPLDDVAVILVDETASQGLDGRAESGRRIADSLEARLKALGGVEVIRRSVVGEDESRIVEAASAALADAPRGQLAGLFIVTDGQASDAARQSELVLDAPVHILSSGRAGEVDRKITLVNAPRYGIVRERARIAFRIDDFGPDETPLGAGDYVQVTLRIDGREALSQPVPVGVEASFEAPLEQPGRLVIELSAEARPGELTARNNTAVLTITAIRDRLRVLLISGEPHAGERVWRNLLKSDPSVDLVHFTILRPIEKGSPYERTEELALIPFPQDELFIEKLSEFDLVIFDRYAYRGVLNAYHFDNIARYVEGGGAVLVATGPEYAGVDSLARQRNIAFILPATPSGTAREGPFRPRLSREGMRHPVTEGLPEQEIWGRWLRILPVTQRSGRALMEGPGSEPLLVLDRVGKGRVGLLLSDHVWLWARGFDGGGPHTELLRRVAHWLMKEPELEDEQLALTDLNGDLVVARRSMDDDPGPVTLTAPSGVETEVGVEPVAPGRFEARIDGAERGLWRARSGDLFAVGAIGLSAAPEFQNVVSDMTKLAPLAARTKGGVFRPRRGDEVVLPSLRRVRSGAADYMGPGWAGIAARGAERIDARADAPVAPPWVWLAVLAAGLAGAWWVEGRARRPRRPEPSGQV